MMNPGYGSLFIGIQNTEMILDDILENGEIRHLD